MPAKRHREPIPWALAICGQGRVRVVTEHGELREAEHPDTVKAVWRSLEGWSVYAASPWRSVVCSTGDAREWMIHTHDRASVTSCQWGKLRVWPIVGALGLAEHESDGWEWAAWDTVREWVGWLRSCGVEPQAMSTVAQRMWTTTLHAPLTLRAPRDLDPQPAVFGSRQQAAVTGSLPDCWYQDLAAAYPSALASLPVATVWRDGPRLDLDRDDGLARVTLTLPDDGSPWGSLPTRTEKGMCEWPADGRQVTGLWALDDLRVAVSAGARIDRVDHVWEARATRHVWAEWWRRALAGRALLNPLVKLTLNRLWSAFCGRPRRGKRIPLDEYASRTHHRWVDDPDRATPRALATQAWLSALCSARVRARLWWEAIEPGKAWYVDTDAAVTGEDDPLSPHGSEAGCWRVQRHMTRVEIAGPQCLRWQQGWGDRWHYAVSGVGSTMGAEAMFKRISERGGRIMHVTRRQSNGTRTAEGEVSL